MNSNFSFTHELALKEEEFREIVLNLEKENRSRFALALIGAAIFIFSVSLLSKYTIALGIVLGVGLLTLGIIHWTVTEKPQKNILWSRMFLWEKVVYSIDLNGISMTSTGFQSKVSWELLSFWKITNNWLVLYSFGLPMLFRIDDLRKNEIYEVVMELVKKHGVEEGKLGIK